MKSYQTIGCLHQLKLLIEVCMLDKSLNDISNSRY